MTLPPECDVVVSIESASRVLIPSLTTSLSTIISIVCLNVFLSFISSTSSVISPSILALTKPAFNAFASSFACSPFLPRTTGARIWNLVPSGKLKILSTIWSTVCCLISLPQTGQ